MGRALYAVLVVLLASTQVFAAEFCYDPVSSDINGVKVGETECQCDVSHYFDEAGAAGNCDAVHSCAEHDELSNLNVKSSVSAVDHTLADGVLSFTAAVAYAPQRHLESLYLGNPTCGYPFTGTRTAASCKDDVVLTAQVSSLVEDCDFIFEDVEGTGYWNGYAVAVVSERLGSLRGHSITRTVTSNIELEITSKTVFDASSSTITLHSEIDVEAAIVSANADPDLGVLVVHMATSVQAPYRLTLSSVTPPVSLQEVITSVTVKPFAECSESPCFQISAASIPTDETCTIDGDWTFTFAVNCLVGDCPALENAVVVANLQLGDICPSITIANEVTGAIAIYADAEGEDTVDSVASGVPLTVEITFDSEIDISSVALTSLSLEHNRELFPLISEGTILNAFIVNDLNTDLVSKTITFTLTVTRSSDEADEADFTLPDENELTLTILAQLDIGYAGGFATGGDIRRSAPGTHMQLKRAVSVRSVAARSTSSASTVGAAATTVVLGAVATAAAFL